MVTEHLIRSTVSTEWTLYGPIGSFSDYKELISAFKDAQEGDSIELKINCSGGDSAVGMMIVQAMRSSRAITVCNVVYPTHSMGSLIAIAGDYLVMQKHSLLMFHTYSCMTGGKSSDMIKDVFYMDASLRGMSDEICTPFLSKSELRRINNGEDFYVTADDSSLPARLKRHYKDIVLNPE